MKTTLPLLFAFFVANTLMAQEATVSGPDGKLKVSINCKPGSTATYSVTYNGKQMLEDSRLGFKADVGDFSTGLNLKGQSTATIDTTYALVHSKTSQVHYRANELTCSFENAKGWKMDVTFRVSDNDVAFRYTVPLQKGRGCIRIDQEETAFKFPSQTTTFMCPQSDPMIGWKRTKPSYEEEYKADAPMNVKSQYGQGYTFPCLFKIGGDGWVLVSETGLDGRYCASHLTDYKEDGYSIAFPMPEEMNGYGTVSPAFALPGSTPWRTLTVGNTLKPVVETTVPWDVVTPRYEASQVYKPGKSTWSWIVWQDNSMNYDDQVKFIDLASKLSYEYILIDAGWDKNIGYPRMEQLINYAHSKNVDVFLWYSSSGFWNDISQSPINHMDNAIIRKKEMKWLHKMGVKGIKVDFFGSDKQDMMRLYEDILSDANDNGLMVIFHGCTLPRGWERMYPNYVGSEAVLASENLVFSQHFCDEFPFNATLHPFIRNTVGSMEWGGTFLNKRLNRGNDGGTRRTTTDAFELAVAILFQNAVQNFALTPNNLEDAPKACIDFMKKVPTTWDETRYIDGYPGKYAVLARRHGDKWYVAGINATKGTLKLNVNLPFLAGKQVAFYGDDSKKEIKTSSLKIKKNGKATLTLIPNGGNVLVEE